MTLYQPEPMENYEIINPVKSEDYDILFEMRGVPLSGNWLPIRIKRVAASKRYRKDFSDFPWLVADALTFRRNAASILSGILKKNGELLPLADEEGEEIFVYNSQVIDALDVKNSILTRLPSGTIFEYLKPVFHSKNIVGCDIFRLPYKGSTTYVSQRFVDQVYNAGLVGLEFKEVWSNYEE
jgi:hypothetical protein